ncbi:ADP-ribosylation factor 6 [Dictyocoela muelleri]|nr:ADP-ribosylation factor 6 [Dictyocoela muelleri]
MGNLFSKIYKSAPKKILILGIGNGGKTSIKNILTSKKEVVHPTIAFNNDTITFEGIKYSIWDISGSINSTKYWKCYFVAVHGIIYVIDSTHPFDESIGMLEKLALDDELKNTVFCILFNKCDLETSTNFDQIEGKIKKIMCNHTYAIYPASAKIKNSIIFPFEWLVRQI